MKRGENEGRTVVQAVNTGKSNEEKISFLDGLGKNTKI
jgi:hypothetical protein